MPCIKIHRIGDDLVGYVGRSCYEQVFLDWFKSGRPSPMPVIEDDMTAIVILSGKILEFKKECLPLEVNMPFWAIGCGAEYAMGAMAAGKTADEAVKIACRFDINCGLGVDVLEVTPSPGSYEDILNRIKENREKKFVGLFQDDSGEHPIYEAKP